MKPTSEQWVEAVDRIGRWLSGKGKPHDFAGHFVAPPATDELGDADREELEAAALETWLRKLEARGAASPTRAAARALEAWRRKQRRRCGLGLAPLPVNEEGEPFEAVGVGASVEEAAIAAIDTARVPKALPALAPRPTAFTGKAYEGCCSRAVQANVWIKQCARSDPARALRWLRCLPAVAALTRVPAFPPYGPGYWAPEARSEALSAVQSAFGEHIGDDAVATAKGVLRALGCSTARAKSLDAHLRMRAQRGAAARCSPGSAARGEE